MYAIVEISGKQFRVKADDRLYIPLQKAAPDASLSFDQVLLVADDADVKVGTPVVEGATVSATVLQHVKADKILVFKKKRRKRFRVKRGHRQPYTQIRITEVSLGGATKAKAKSRKKEAPAEEAASAE